MNENMNVFRSQFSKKLSKPFSHMFDNTGIDENKGEYLSELTNPLLDTSDPVIPLTSDILLFTHRGSSNGRDD